MKKEIIAFLREAQAIIESDGETDFESIKGAKKTDIARLFADSFDYDTDGDSGECWMYIDTVLNGISCWISFSSRCEYTEDIIDTVQSMDIRVSAGDTEYETICDAIRLLESSVGNALPVALLNTSILTTAGTYTLVDISLEAARQIVSDNDTDSAIGHESTAETMTTLLNVDVPVNRQIFEQKIGQQALVFKLNGRPQEGIILTAEEIERIGYKFQLLTRIS